MTSATLDSFSSSSGTSVPLAGSEIVGPIDRKLEEVEYRLISHPSYAKRRNLNENEHSSGRYALGLKEIGLIARLVDSSEGYAPLDGFLTEILFTMSTRCPLNLRVR